MRNQTIIGVDYRGRTALANGRQRMVTVECRELEDLRQDPLRYQKSKGQLRIYGGCTKRKASKSISTDSMNVVRLYSRQCRPSASSACLASFARTRRR